MSFRGVWRRLTVSGLALLVFAAGADSAQAQDDDPTPEPAGVSLRSFESIQYPDVRSIAQDRQGFVWLGLNHQIDGALIRHDGYVGKRYVHDLDDVSSLSHDQISVTYVDNEGVLWVGTIRGGLNRYNADTDDFTRYQHVPGDDTTLPNDDIKSMLQTSDGTRWVGTEVGLARLDADSATWTSFRSDPDVPNSLAGNRVQAIVENTATGELWLGTNDGLSVFDPATTTFRNYASSDDPTSLSDPSVRSIVRDDNGVWWLGTGAGIDRYNPETDDFTRMSPVAADDADTPSAPAVESMLEDSQGRMWVGHDRGLHLFDRTSGELVEFVDQPTWDAVIGQSPVHALYEDNDGGVWVGTRLNGVARIAPTPRSIEYFRHDPDDPTSINSDFVARVDATSDGLWLVTDTGVEFFDGSAFTDYTATFGLDDGWPSVHGVLAPGDQTVWLGFNDGRLARVDLESGQPTYFEVPAPANRAAVWPVAEAANGDLWFRVPWGFGVGVLHPNGESELLIGDALDPTGPEQAYGFNTSHYFDAEEQVLWVTGLGLTRIDLATSAVDVYPFVTDAPEAVANQLWSVDAGPAGHLWLGSSNGVHEFDPVTREYVALHTAGLPSTGATDARYAPDGRIWIVSVATLSGLDPATGEVTVYSANDESVAQSRLDMENWVSSKLEVGPDGRLYAPTLEEGLVAFSPELVPDDPTPPPAVLTGFELFGQEVEPGGETLALPVNLAQRITLAPEQNTFTFAFSALDYEHPEHNEFRYRLDGFDSDWHYTPADRRFATYTNVPPGQYTFRVQASNGDDVWTADEAVVAVTVATPWYQSWWARLLAVLALVLVLIGVVRWRTRYQRQRNHELEERLVERIEHQEERELLLARVQEQSERLEGILAAAPVSVVLLGPDRTILIQNEVAVDEFNALSVFDEHDRLVTFAGLSLEDDLLSEAGDWKTAVTELDGAKRTITMIVRPILPDTDIDTGLDTDSAVDDQDAVAENAGASAEVRGWALIWEDNTNLARLQERRARQDRLAAVGRFAAGIAHDVNNVLTVIGLNAELLSLDPTVSGRSREHVDRIARETGNASKFVTKILDFSRQSVSERQLLDVGAAVGSQVGQLAEVIDRSVRLEYRGDQPATVLADPIQLERIVLNLVRNAQDAVGESGSIMVVVDHVLERSEDGNSSATADEGSQPTPWIRLAVVDDGTGIDPEILPTIFEPFVSTKAEGKGTGLGLAQVVGIAAEHDGHVTVESEVGVGTAVAVWFPGADPDEFNALTAAPISLLVSGRGGIHAVVVDGDLNARPFIARPITPADW